MTYIYIYMIRIFYFNSLIDSHLLNFFRFKNLDSAHYILNTRKLRSLGFMFKSIEEMLDDCVASPVEQGYLTFPSSNTPLYNQLNPHNSCIIMPLGYPPKNKNPASNLITNKYIKTVISI